MTTRITLVFIVLAQWISCFAQAQETKPEFTKLRLTDRYYCDGIDAGDINGDGQLDVVAGPFWYEGPEFKTAHEFYEAVPLPPEESPSNSMFSFVHDFNGDGRLDILVLGRVHKHAAYWYENPGTTNELWERHFVFERVRGESPTLVDLDGDGIPQLLTHWEGAWGYLEPDPDRPTEPWTFHAIGENEDWPQFYHGQGVGDLNGDGRLDYVINDGWYEQPKDRDQLWTFHRVRFSQDRGGAQIGIFDVDGDGDNDAISAVHAHEWGLAWYENQGDALHFEEHLIMSDRSREGEFGVAFSQPHALDFADVNGDGLTDIVTGKRMWAHGPTGDVEPMAAPVVYWFELTRNDVGEVRYHPHQIDDSSGVGVQICTKDVNADGRVDVLTTSKIGTFVFINHEADGVTAEARLPSEVLQLDRWKLTLPINTQRKGNPDEVVHPELESFVKTNCFSVSNDGSGVAFRAHCGGAATTGSNYPRCELREMQANGQDEIAWSTDDGGEHVMQIELAITQTPKVKQHVVCAQIHDDEDDVLMVRLEGKKLFIERNGANDVRLDSDYQLGERFRLQITTGNGRIKADCNGEQKMDWEVSQKNCYFKTGCYTQSNIQRGDASEAYGEVVIYKLNVEHK